METPGHPARSDHPERIPAHKMPDYLPATAYRPFGHSLNSQVQIQLFRHQTTRQSLMIPAVAEPLLVLIVSGAAIIEERSGNGEWTATPVAAGDFFLTTSPLPYEMRWQAESDEGFEVMHVYLSQHLLDLAARDIVSGPDSVQQLREVSGERDPEVTRLMSALYHEVTSSPQASSLYLQGVGQALAVHLARRYGDGGEPSRHVNALPAYKLHKAISTLQTEMGSAFSLDRLASEAGMSVSHFSRLFKKATGQSPSQYFIHLRMEAARELLLESDLSILNIALEVGYGSPSYFAHLFRRHTGITPREYRHRG